MDISALPFEERRVVVVTSDIRKRSRAEVGADIGALVGHAPMVLGILGFPLLLITKPLGRGVGFIVGAINDARHGNVPPLKDAPSGMILALPQDAKRDLTFPAGHPVMQGAYAGHPLDPERYYPVAHFHQVLFQEKADELMRILAGLGATRVRIHATKGYRSQAAVSAGASQGKNGMNGSVAASENQSHDCKWEETFAGVTVPGLPSDLVWYHEERPWQELARRRLEYRTAKARTVLLYENSYCVDAKVKAVLEGMSFSIGGTFKEFESTEWDVEVEFAG